MKVNNNVAISNSGFIFNATRGDSFTTNPIGLDILNWLKEGKTTEEIISNIVEKYEVDATKSEIDVLDFFKMLKEYHLTE